MCVHHSSQHPNIVATYAYDLQALQPQGRKLPPSSEWGLEGRRRRGPRPDCAVLHMCKSSFWQAVGVPDGVGSGCDCALYHQDLSFPAPLCLVKAKAVPEARACLPLWPAGSSSSSDHSILSHCEPAEFKLYIIQGGWVRNNSGRGRTTCLLSLGQAVWPVNVIIYMILQKKAARPNRSMGLGWRPVLAAISHTYVEFSPLWPLSCCPAALQSTATAGRCSQQWTACGCCMTSPQAHPALCW